MTTPIHLRSVPELKQRYPALLDPNATPEDRKAQLDSVRHLVTAMRHMGIADEINPAVDLLREAGFGPRAKGLSYLAALGIREELLRIPGATETDLYYVQLLLQRRRKRPEEVTSDDVAEHLRDVALERGVDAANRHRIHLGRFYEKFAPLRQGFENPSPLRRKGAALVVEDLGPQLKAEYDALVVQCAAMRFAPSTRTSILTNFMRAARWMPGGPEGAGSLSEATWVAGGAEAFLKWWCQPLSNGQLRSDSAPAFACTVLRNLWLASKHELPAVEDRARAVRRSLRVNGSETGPFTAVDLRSIDPAPAPSAKRIEEVRAQLAEEIDIARKTTQIDVLRRLLRERAVTETLIRLGIRFSSLASLRIDRICLNEEDDSLYFDDVLVKGDRNRRENVVPVRRERNRTYSRWSFNTDLLAMYQECALADGFDLIAYLRTRQPQHVLWVTPDEPETFGDIAVGKQIAPLWRNLRGGYLQKATLAQLIDWIMRRRFGLERGRAHAFRRRFVIDTEEIARKYPEAVEGVGHMRDGTRGRYRRSVERSSTLVLPNRVSPRAVIAGDVALSVPGTTASRPKLVSRRDVTRPRTREGEVSYDDLFGTGA